MPLHSLRSQGRGSFWLLNCLLLLVGCGSQPPAPPIKPQANQPIVQSANALFEEVAGKAGVRFTHQTGASEHYYFIENTAAGCAFLDYDNDGFLDILLIQSGSSENPKSKIQNPKSERPHCVLYHNNGNGTFTDVTAGSGLDTDLGYGQGVAIGDYDNDGYDDIFITGFGGNHLFHNEGRRQKTEDRSQKSEVPPKLGVRGRTPLFRDVTKAMGLDKVHSTGYATSAAFGDYDNDGKLDLYVCYYTSWTWEKDVTCKNREGQRDYCAPDLYDADTHRLFHNEGNRFVDVSEKAGITKACGRGLAVAFYDYNGDGKQDIFVANDLTPNMLWRNNGNGTFTEVAVKAGCAYSEVGSSVNGMGIGIADYDHSGQESLFITNFSDKPNTLYKNIGGVFEDKSMASGLALPHLPYLAWACDFLDYDADGWRDLLVANGHVQRHIDGTGAGVTYKERKQLFHNERNGTFKEIKGADLEGDLATPTVSRGMAIGDFDNDGRLDALVSNQNGSAQLFHNRDRSQNHWVCFKTIGTKSNRDGIHAKFTLRAGGMTQVASVRGGSSYLSSSDRRVYFGLGTASKIDQVEIRWPSGTRDVLNDVKVDAIHTVTEGKGMTK